MFISGLDKLSYYKFNRPISKRILFLGEIHESKGLCDPTVEDSITVPNFLLNLMKKIPKGERLDIFLEGFYKIGSFTESKDADSILVETGKMLEFIKSSCDCDQLRVHYADPRVVMEDDETFLTYPLGGKAKYHKEIKELVTEQEILGAINYLLTINKEENQKHFIKVFKSIDQLGFATVELIKRWEIIYFKIIEKELSKLDESVVTRDKLISSLSKVYRYLLDERTFPKDRIIRLLKILLCLPMDVYILSRIFIRFKDETTIKNVVVYTGSGHIEVYEAFLFFVFNDYPDVESKSSDNCLAVPKFDFWK